jgi:hypothetical protein
MALAVGSMIDHPTMGEGVIFSLDESNYRVYFKDKGEMTISKQYDGFELLEEGSIPDSTITLEDVVDAVHNVFEQYQEVNDIIELGDRWEGGTMTLQPGDADLKAKEIPMETFFHKIVMVRDRLRVLEQSINSHKKLTDEDKVHMQQYITRMYGSLTTFNVLFEHRKDWFVGESKIGDE